VAWKLSDLWDGTAQDATLARAVAPIHRDAIQAAYRAAGDAGVDAVYDAEAPRLRRLVDGLGGRVAGVNATTRDALRGTVLEGIDRGYTMRQIADGIPALGYGGVSGVFDAARRERADLIARTETSMAYNTASVAAYESGGVSYVEVSDGADDAACADADGAIWTLDEAEADPLAHPACRRQFWPAPAGKGA